MARVISLARGTSSSRAGSITSMTTHTRLSRLTRMGRQDMEAWATRKYKTAWAENRRERGAVKRIIARRLKAGWR